MNENYKKTGREDTPSDTCADQPSPPKDGGNCKDLPETTRPTLHEPKPCQEPNHGCNCPTTPLSTPNCLATLINEQEANIALAAKAEASKKVLNDLLTAVNAAQTSYTQAKYETLLAEWLKQDAAIAELIRKLVCAVPCWRCILDCYVCPLLDDYHHTEKWLYDDTRLYSKDEYHVYDLYDLRYWHQRNKAAKQRRFDRVQNVLNAWSNPAKTIGDALSLNRSLIDSACKVIGCEEPGPGTAIYDVFVRILTLHLSIAPPMSPQTTTKIDREYTQLCECAQVTSDESDECCGPNVGELSLAQRLVGAPHAYLIQPSKYVKLFCCLVEKHFAPAKDALSRAERELAEVERQIAEAEAKFGKQTNGNDAPAGRQPAGNGTPARPGWITSFERDARAAIPSKINCSDYEQDEETTHQTSSRNC